MFIVDPAFEAGSARLATLDLSEARLQLDARFPWLILIPKTAHARELDDLMAHERHQLIEEIVLAGRAVRAMGEARGRPVEKLNVGLLGNVTAQLHAHVVGRRLDDSAWPGPVWGYGESEPYLPADRVRVEAAARAVFSRAASGSP